MTSQSVYKKRAVGNTTTSVNVFFFFNINLNITFYNPEKTSHNNNKIEQKKKRSTMTIQ